MKTDKSGRVTQILFRFIWGVILIVIVILGWESCVSHAADAETTIEIAQATTNRHGVLSVRIRRHSPEMDLPPGAVGVAVTLWNRDTYVEEIHQGCCSGILRGDTVGWRMPLFGVAECEGDTDLVSGEQYQVRVEYLSQVNGQIRRSGESEPAVVEWKFRDRCIPLGGVESVAGE